MSFIAIDKRYFDPSLDQIAGSQLTAYMHYCERETGQIFPCYDAFQEFSVSEFRSFWNLFLKWSGIAHEGEADPVCTGELCEDATFFPNLRINFAEALLGSDDADDDRVAITARHFDGSHERLTRGELRRKTARLAAFLESCGVREGDRVAVIARNGAEAVIAALATASLGAAFSSCAPEMGAFAIVSRFAPLEPAVLMGCLRTERWDVGIAVADRVAEVAAQLPALKTVIALDDGPVPDAIKVPVHRFAGIVASTDIATDKNWRRFPFNQPLFIMFSSGTTGAPKCIVHGAGGTLLEHVKEHRLHCDLKPEDKLFFQTSCAWMMWNWQLTALASRVEFVVYDGPVEGPETLWRIVEEEAVTVFGTSPAYLQLCSNLDFVPAQKFRLSKLRAMLSTGSILYPHHYDWVRGNVKELPLQSISGGTDIIGCFVLGNPNLPVYRGEAQCRSLGLDVRALPPAGEAHATIGELICANPFPSRPLGFYGDSDGKRFHKAYFSQNPGVWTHGDLIEFSAHGGACLHGRSDGILNVRGVRIGPAEIYRILQDMPEVAEAMAVEQDAPNEPGGTRMVLLVVLHPGNVLDDALAQRIRFELSRRGSPVMVPSRIAQVDALPATHNGKRSEAAARDAVNGRAVVNRDALQNPQCLEAIAAHPALRDAREPVRPGKENLSSMTLQDLERDLQRLCKGVLGLNALDVSENLLGTGADSLSIISMLIEINARYGIELPASALFQKPTVGGLARFILEGSEGQVYAAQGEVSPEPSVRQSVQIRPAAPSDIEPVCRLLSEGYGNNVSPDTWRPLFDYNWGEEKPALGFVAADKQEIVGFIGAVYSKREINGKTGIVCNLSSWYVHPKYRNWSLPLLAAAVRDETISYTALTPADITGKALKTMGFSPLGAGKMLFPSLSGARTFFGRSPVVTFDSGQIERRLNAAQLQIYQRHRQPYYLHAAVIDGEDYCYIVAKRRTLIWHRLLIRYSDILYCSAPELLLRHLERVKLAVLWKQKTFGLAVHETWAPQLRSLGIPELDQPLFRSPVFEAKELDRLYSELSVLPV